MIARRIFRSDLVDPLPRQIRGMRNLVIHQEGELVEHKGKPYVLYGMWDYAEDWSGESVRDCANSLFLTSAKKLPEAEWLALLVQD